MPDEPRRIYWDANVPLSYINGVAERVPIIDELFRQARAGEIELLTSAISRVEIAFVQSEEMPCARRAKPRSASTTCGSAVARSRRSSSTT